MGWIFHLRWLDGRPPGHPDFVSLLSGSFLPWTCLCKPRAWSTLASNSHSTHQCHLPSSCYKVFALLLLFEFCWCVWLVRAEFCLAWGQVRYSFVSDQLSCHDVGSDQVNHANLLSYFEFAESKLFAEFLVIPCWYFATGSLLGLPILSYFYSIGDSLQLVQFLVTFECSDGLWTNKPTFSVNILDCDNLIYLVYLISVYML